jgi:hypothetical protein
MKLLTLVLAGLLLVGCAEVPKQSVDISAALGNDLAETRRAHLRLVDLYFAKMESDANRFVDNVYAPYQINKTLEEYQKILIDAIIKGASEKASDKDRRTSFEFLEVYLTEVRNDIEAFRAKSLLPIREQRKIVAQKINDSYSNMVLANTTVTAYLASLVKVKDAQNEVLTKLGGGGWQEQISGNLTDASDKIDQLNKEAGSNKDKVKKAIDQFESLMQSVAKP